APLDGLCQWPAPALALEFPHPRPGPGVEDAMAPPPGSYTKRRPPATTGLVPAFPFCHSGRSSPSRSVHAAVPPLSAANSQVAALVRSTAGAVKRAAPDGTTWRSPPRCGSVPRISPQSSSRIDPSLPPCAIKPPPSSTGDVEPKSASRASSASVLVGV